MNTPEGSKAKITPGRLISLRQFLIGSAVDAALNRFDVRGLFSQAQGTLNAFYQGSIPQHIIEELGAGDVSLNGEQDSRRGIALCARQLTKVSYTRSEREWVPPSRGSSSHTSYSGGEPVYRHWPSRPGGYETRDIRMIAHMGIVKAFSVEAATKESGYDLVYTHQIYRMQAGGGKDYTGLNFEKKIDPDMRVFITPPTIIRWDSPSDALAKLLGADIAKELNGGNEALYKKFLT